MVVAEAVLPPQPWQGAGFHQHSSVEPDLLPAEVLVAEEYRTVLGRTTEKSYRRKALVGAETAAVLVAVLVALLPNVRLCCCHVLH